MCYTIDGETPSMFAYYRSPDDMRIEIVDRNIFGDFDTFLKAFSMTHGHPAVQFRCPAGEPGRAS